MHFNSKRVYPLDMMTLGLPENFKDPIAGFLICRIRREGRLVGFKALTKNEFPINTLYLKINYQI